ncbi:hypothetical protein BDZ97DRAFT_1431142 [Flammula alnicola]|nr:hypothetical protein BDZ97DRAFT_1431142 [Flammula alnicola]
MRYFYSRRVTLGHKRETSRDPIIPDSMDFNHKFSERSFLHLEERPRTQGMASLLAGIAASIAMASNIGSGFQILPQRTSRGPTLNFCGSEVERLLRVCRNIVSFHMTLCTSTLNGTQFLSMREGPACRGQTRNLNSKRLDALNIQGFPGTCFRKFLAIFL